MAKAVSNRKLIIFSVLAYLSFLLVMFPLNVIYKLVNPQGLPVQVVAVSGTIWNGEVIAKHQLTGQVKTRWELNPLSLLIGAVDTAIEVESTEINGALNVELNVLTQKTTLSNLNAYISTAFINKVAKRSRVSLTGDVEISNVSVTYDIPKRYTEFAEGRVVWLGGNASYPKGRKTVSATLPMLIADVGYGNGEMNVNAHTTENLSVATATLKTDGWGSVAVLKRMVDLIGEKWPNKASADTVVFEISEKVF